ncbi:MAG: hypothetical protein RLZ98_750 [Pseudomonadota bacterium]|jgi:hypothetical protein
MTPEHINPMQWHQAMGIARQSCARIFRDGGTPEDAMVAFGLKMGTTGTDWTRTVEAIAETLCKQPVVRRAA